LGLVAVPAQLMVPDTDLNACARDRALAQAIRISSESSNVNC
jgi:hypothetical protein